MELVQPNSKKIRLHLEKQRIINDVKKILVEIPNIHLLKNDIQFIHYILELILNAVHHKVEKDISMTDVCVEIMTQLFPSMSSEEKDTLRNSIDFLVSSNQVRKVNLKKRIMVGLVKYFLK